MVLLVLDTSVILKWFTQEKYSGNAIQIRNEFYDGLHELVEPDLLVYEFVNVLRYNPNYTADDVKKAVDSLIDVGIDITIPTAAMLKRSVDLAKKHNITAYDATFLAVADMIGATMVTADEKLYRNVKDLRFLKFISAF